MFDLFNYKCILVCVHIFVCVYECSVYIRKLIIDQSFSGFPMSQEKTKQVIQCFSFVQILDARRKSLFEILMRFLIYLSVANIFNTVKKSIKLPFLSQTRDIFLHIFLEFLWHLSMWHNIHNLKKVYLCKVLYRNGKPDEAFRCGWLEVQIQSKQVITKVKILKCFYWVFPITIYKYKNYLNNISVTTSGSFKTYKNL